MTGGFSIKENPATGNNCLILAVMDVLKHLKTVPEKAKDLIDFKNDNEKIQLAKEVRNKIIKFLKLNADKNNITKDKEIKWRDIHEDFDNHLKTIGNGGFLENIDIRALQIMYGLPDFNVIRPPTPFKYEPNAINIADVPKDFLDTIDDDTKSHNINYTINHYVAIIDTIKHPDVLLILPQKATSGGSIASSSKLDCDWVATDRRVAIYRDGKIVQKTVYANKSDPTSLSIRRVRLSKYGKKTVKYIAVRERD